jgi:hypothetical protein
MDVHVCVSWALKLLTSASKCPTNSPCGGAGKPAGRAGSKLGSVLCDMAGTTIEEVATGRWRATLRSPRAALRSRTISAALCVVPPSVRQALRWSHAPVPRLAAAVSQRPHGREHGWEWASEGAGAEQDGHGRWWHSRVICLSSWGASQPSMCLERPWRRLAVRIGHRVDPCGHPCRGLHCTRTNDRVHKAFVQWRKASTCFPGVDLL